MTRFAVLRLRAAASGLRALSFLSPPLAGRLATYLWFTPFPFARPLQPPLPTGARAFAAESGGRAVRGYEMGDGPRRALLVHGWAGSSRQYRRLALRLAAEGYRVVALDLPGHGGDEGASTHLYDIVGAIEAAASAIGPVDLVVAHSLGAMAVGVAMGGSLRADRVVVLAPGLRPRHALESFSRTLRLRAPVIRRIERAMEERFGSGVWDRVPETVLAAATPDATLVVHDEEDDTVPIEDARTLSRRWGATMAVTRGHGHNGILRSADVIDRIVEFARTPGAPSDVTKRGTAANAERLAEDTFDPLQTGAGARREAGESAPKAKPGGRHPVVP